MADLADMLSDLLSDPETGKKLLGLLDENKQPEQKPPMPEKHPDSKKAAGGGSNELPELLSALTEGKKDGGDLSGLISSLASGSKKDGGDLSGLISSLAGGSKKDGGDLSGLLGSLASGSKKDGGDLSGLISSLAGGSKKDGGDLSGLISSLAGGHGGGLLPDGVDPAMMLKLKRAMTAMSSNQNDSRTRLLYDLKPYISKARARRVDEAAQMLQIIRVMDIFRDDGGKDRD